MFKSFCLYLSVTLVWLVSVTERPFFFLSGPGSRRQVGEACGCNNAAGWEEEAVQQPAGSEGAHWGGDGGLPHETQPARWSHGFLPGTVTSSYPYCLPETLPKDSTRAELGEKNVWLIQLNIDLVNCSRRLSNNILFVILYTFGCHRPIDVTNGQ